MLFLNGWAPWQIAGWLFVILLGLTAHEFGHSAMAIAVGDDTPRRMGRLTLNPLAHIDVFGFVMIALVGFGWARPVMIDPRRLAKPVRDEILISLAGPLANVLFAVLIMLCYGAAAWAGVSPATTAGSRALWLLAYGALANVSLAIFNLLPIPPLDGSHLLTTWLFRVNPAVAAKYFQYGSLALIALVIYQTIARVDILPVGRWALAIVQWMARVIGL